MKSSTELDFPEVTLADKKEFSVEDKIFLDKVNSTIRLTDGHYEIGLPFREEHVHLPDNRKQAVQRLNSLSKILSKNKDLHCDYTNFMEKIISKGYAEVLPVADLSRHDGRVWYIPHHSVYHLRKPGKIRVVFDCAAVFMGVSLNKLLLQGPDLTNPLLEVLMNLGVTI